MTHDTRISPKRIQCSRCGNWHTVTTRAKMNWMLLSCYICENDFDAKKRKELMKQIESILRDSKPTTSN